MAKQEEATQEQEAEIQMSKLESFWDALGNKSESTKSGYRTAILQFMTFIFPKVEVTKENIDKYVDQYFSENRNYFDDFKKFIQITLTTKPTLSALQTFNQIKNFFSLCEVLFSPKQVKLLKAQLPNSGKGGITQVATVEEDLDRETIRNILQHCDVKMKSILLCLASGGFRIDELLQVKCADVDLNVIPAKITIRKTKTGSGRYTFISSEAVTAVREWIKIRPAYLQEASLKGKNFKTKKVSVGVDDERLFPISDNTVRDDFKKAIVGVFGNNQIDPTTKRSVRHFHSFRKFFITQLGDVASEPFADFLAGHKTALSDSYRRYTTKQTAEKYLKGEHMLYVMADEKLLDMSISTKKEIADMQKDSHQTTRTLVASLAREAELNKSVRDHEKTIRTQQETLESMQAQMKDMNTTVKSIFEAIVKSNPEGLAALQAQIAKNPIQ